MLTVTLVAGGALVASLPFWFPRAVVALRARIFTWINGEEGIAVPGKTIGGAHFKRLYAQPAANGRSRGAALSDLFWYWLAPGPEIHQEHLEAGERYDQVARATRRILSIPGEAAEELTANCVERMLARAGMKDVTLVRLRDLMMPVWAEFYYELLFGEQCSDLARRLIVGNANDVVTALKCCGLRHMKKRQKLTEYLIDKLKSQQLPHQLPACLSLQERALSLQGTFFNTAVVQMSEAMAHLFMVIAQHPPVQSKLMDDFDDDRYLDRVIAETLRLYPLFGISHRITTAEIRLDERTVLPEGSVLCFNHPEFHRTGYEDAERFDPERWETLMPRAANYIPFGVAANRPCPAHRLAPITVRVAARHLLRRFALYSSASHTRSLPNRGPCLLVRRGAHCDRYWRAALLLWMRLRDAWEDVTRSAVQLALGSYMVWDARRLRLCERYFERQAQDNAGATCRFSAQKRAGSPLHWVR